jgi:hypothetical protein
LSAVLAIQLALGFLTGLVEGWSLGDAVYFTFITGLTIGYGDLVPRQALTRALAIGIGFFGLFVTALIAAIAVHAMRSALTDDGSGKEFTHPTRGRQVVMADEQIDTAPQNQRDDGDRGAVT